MKNKTLYKARKARMRHPRLAVEHCSQSSCWPARTSKASHGIFRKWTEKGPDTGTHRSCSLIQRGSMCCCRHLCASEYSWKYDCFILHFHCNIMQEENYVDFSNTIVQTFYLFIFLNYILGNFLLVAMLHYQKKCSYICLYKYNRMHKIF